MNCMIHLWFPIRYSFAAFNVTGALSTVEKIEVSRKEDFQLKMDLYETAAFDTKATPPMQVTLNEPIYVCKYAFFSF